MRIWLTSAWAFCLVCGQAAATNLDVSGLWWTAEEDSVVEIRDCGDGTPCGFVAWVDESRGGMVADENNRDDTLRGRHMVGITLLQGFSKAEQKWKKGLIYNPKDGRHYRAKIELLSENLLAVSGCLGPICKKLLWKRAEGVGEDITRRSEAQGEDLASL